MQDNDDFGEGDAVEVRYPRSKQEEQGDRDAWPWLPGVILAKVADDEYDIMVTDRKLATLDDGSPAPDDTHWGDLCHPGS